MYDIEEIYKEAKILPASLDTLDLINIVAQNISTWKIYHAMVEGELGYMFLRE